MTKIQPVIKWSGSKRKQSEIIVSHMPNKIKTYYEPFVGGGSVFIQLLHSDIKFDRVVCSDINKDLIDLWKMIKYNPQYLIEEYNRMWNEMNSTNDISTKKEYYFNIRKEFNETRKPELFLFLSRTCMNGLIRYNNSGNFNTSLHLTRKGIEPDTLSKIITLWSNKINQYNVEFNHQSYENISTIEGDFIYLDPPYSATKGMYNGTLDYEVFWDWMRNQEGDYILSFDGKRGNIDNTYNVPSELFSSHNYLNNGRSSFKDLKVNVVEDVFESLYIK